MVDKVRELYRRLLYYLHRERFDRELDEEIRAHLEMKAEANSSYGMPPEKARRSATLEFGNPTLIREASREVLSFRRLEALIQDFRYGFRMLFQKDRGFTFTAILILGLGIGAATTIFSILNAVLLKPLAYADPDGIVTLWRYNDSAFSGPDLADLADQSRAFEDLSEFNPTGFNMAWGIVPERVQGLRVSASFFRILGANPAFGRAFQDGEGRPGASPVAVVSNTLWRDRLASNKDILGKQINLDGRSYTVIGVMPAGFDTPYQRADVIVPAAEDLRALDRENYFLRVIGRIKQGVTVEQAQSDAARVANQLDEEHPLKYGRRQFRVIRLQEVIVERAVPILAVLVAAVLFVLLITCANIASLLLSRAVSRQKEVSIRAALGASRLRLVQQFLSEAFLLALPGGALGLVLAIEGTALIVRATPDYVLEYLPGWRAAGVDGRVLWVTMLVSALTAVLFGLAPALHSARRNISGSLGEVGSTSTPGAGQSKLTELLAGAEVALAFVLLVGAGLMVRTLGHLASTHPGFDPHNILTARLALPATKYKAPEQRAMFWQEVLDKVRGLPQVDSAGEISDVPLSGSNLYYWRFQVGGSSVSGPDEPHDIRMHLISPGCLEALRIPILDGRAFDEHDGEGALPVAMINERMAGLFWPKATAVGQQIRVGNQWATIIGVAGDVLNSGNFQQDSEVYLPYIQHPESDGASLTVRTVANQTGVAAEIRNAVMEVDPGQAVYDIRSMEQVISDWTFPQRMVVWLLGSFAAVALLLAGAGIYGVMAYSVTRRTQEFGVRIALGATRTDLVKTVLKGGLVIASAGLAIGLMAGFGLSRLMAAILYGVSPSDPISFATGFLFLMLISLTACYLPARRAARVDPMISLRHE